MSAIVACRPVREALGSRRGARHFVDAGLAVPGQVGGRLALARGGVEIRGRQRADRGGPHSSAPRLGPADGDRAARQVRQHGGAGQRPLACRAGSGTHRSSQISTPTTRPGRSSAANSEVGAETAPRGRRPGWSRPRCRRRRRSGASRRTPGSSAGRSSARRRAAGRAGWRRRSCRAGGAMRSGAPTSDQRPQVAPIAAITRAAPPRPRPAGLLQQQVVDRVGRQSEFGEYRERRSRLMAGSGEAEDRLRVALGLRRMAAAGAGRHSGEAVAIDGAKARRSGRAGIGKGEGRIGKAAVSRAPVRRRKLAA